MMKIALVEWSSTQDRTSRTSVCTCLSRDVVKVGKLRRKIARATAMTSILNLLLCLSARWWQDRTRACTLIAARTPGSTGDNAPRRAGPDHPPRCDHSTLAERPQCSAVVYPGVQTRPDDIPGGTRRRRRPQAGRRCGGSGGGRWRPLLGREMRL